VHTIVRAVNTFSIEIGLYISSACSIWISKIFRVCFALSTNSYEISQKNEKKSRTNIHWVYR
jgi:hypothetical protein